MLNQVVVDVLERWWRRRRRGCVGAGDRGDEGEKKIKEKKGKNK